MTAKKKPVTPAVTTVRVRVARAWLGGPPLGETVTITETDRVRKLIRSGFLKRV